MRNKVLRYLKDKVMPLYQPTNLGKAITDSMLEHPDDWFFNHQCTAKHLPSGIEVWISNDIQHRRIYTAPDGINKDAINETLSYGDRVAIEEVVQMLRRRCPEPTGVDRGS